MTDAQALSALRKFVDAGGTVNVRGSSDKGWQAQAVTSLGTARTSSADTFAKAIAEVLDV